MKPRTNNSLKTALRYLIAHKDCTSRTATGAETRAYHNMITVHFELLLR